MCPKEGIGSWFMRLLNWGREEERRRREGEGRRKKERIEGEKERVREERRGGKGCDLFLVASEQAKCKSHNHLHAYPIARPKFSVLFLTSSSVGANYSSMGGQRWRERGTEASRVPPCSEAKFFLSTYLAAQGKPVRSRICRGQSGAHQS